MRTLICLVLLILLNVDVSRQEEEDIPHNQVRNWALKFGVDLWEFGKLITKMNEIKKKYLSSNAVVIRKDGLLLVREMAAEVKNMMDFKINAVMKLMENAEQTALSVSSDSTSSTKYYVSNRINLFSKDERFDIDSQNLPVTGNRHFDHIAVNLSLSDILMPSGVKDTESDVTSGLQWSEKLNRLFINNYESDPTLSWQYFGSTSGFLRRFPAISWPEKDTSPSQNGLTRIHTIDDFRLSEWFIGSATSPKDLAILIDSSSLYSIKHRTLIIRTTCAILDTLGPNDFVNIYHFAESTKEIVTCFKDVMMIASPDNVKQLKMAMNNLIAESPSNISAALSTAFEILQKYNRSSQGSQCNQAIMLITARTEGAPVELIKHYNSPHMPVRIFTYIVGPDSSPELQTMSCTNKGYYTKIKNMDEIKSKVFEYIKVLARPIVLYQRDHPIHWTPVYIGGKSSRYGLETQGQLMTSVTAPILDRRNHTVRTANLLGIVGTDIPIEQIQKLVPPYKLGVNGYSFLVDNNGRVMYHPDLRPLPENTEYQETLKPKYISVDLSEVEFSEFDGSMYSLNNSFLLDLRHDMIDQKEGETEFSVKIHYDEMKRVTIRRHNYFYKPIEDTPFSLGLALPEEYGMFELHAEQEIRHARVNVTRYFNENDWKVHPDWTYCEYYFESEKWFATPEERVLHFLIQAHNPGWKWRSMRHRKPMSKPDKDYYYCDKELLQSLVLDAWVTDGFYKLNEKSMQKDENKGIERFGVVRSFVATRSGLLRWHDYQKNQDNLEETKFAETYRRSMDTTWYKRAVDQHVIEPDSFVFSVPFDATENARPLVTATHAIFVETKGHKAPAAVVGIQFRHAALTSHFINVTSACFGTDVCKKNCASDELDCYILDNNGFTIISEKQEHTGKFFGDIDGTIMDSLVQDKIFRKVSVIDYQGICSPQSSHVSAAQKSSSISIWKTIVAINNFIWTWTLNLNFVHVLRPIWAYGSKIDGSIRYTDNKYSQYINDQEKVENQESPLNPPIVQTPVTPVTSTFSTTMNFQSHNLRTCEKKTDLYILQADRLNSSGQSNPLKGKLTNCNISGCERPFSVQKISYTNLILLVVDTLCPCGDKKLGIRPFEALTDVGACMARRERLYRRRPCKCINYHPEELEIKACSGINNTIRLTLKLLFICIFTEYYL